MADSDDSDFVSDEWTPDGPDVRQDFNEAAKQQVEQTSPPPSEGGISTKAELDKRVEQTRILKENLARRSAPTLKPKGATAQNAAEGKYQEDKTAFEENERIKEQIRLRLEQKKKQEMHREFNRAANPSRD